MSSVAFGIICGLLFTIITKLNELIAILSTLQ